MSAPAPHGLPDRPWRWSLAAIALASLAVCLLVDLLYFGGAPLLGDDERFLHSAAVLLATGQFRGGSDVAWEMPGTAALIAGVSALHLASPLASIRVANALLVAVQSTLLGLLAARVFRDRLAGLLAAAIAGFYPYLVFTQSMAMSETPAIFLLVAGLLALRIWRDRGARLDATLLAATALLTAATLTKGAFTVLPPLLVGATALGTQPWPQVLRRFALAAAVFAVLMAPWWWRNATLLGRFVPFTTSSSLNLYMGNSPNNPDVATYFPYLPRNWSVADGVALEDIPGELDRYRGFRDAALAYIRADPWAFVRRAAVKFAVFWNIVPNAPAFRQPLYRVAGAASFGPVLALALLGTIRRRRALLPLLPYYLLIGYVTLLYTITIPSIRYRLPIEPVLILLAAGTLAGLLRRTAAGRWPG